MQVSTGGGGRAQFLLLLCKILLVASALSQTPTAAWKESAGNTQDNLLSLAGLHDRVTVRRDERGIPYIEAANDEDLYFAQGYVTAADRMWQMEFWRHLTRGELAEIVGESAVEGDKFFRVYGFADLSEKVVSKMSPSVRKTYEAYARGVNAYIESLNDQNLPREFRFLNYKPRPWRASDSVVVGKSVAMALSSSWRMDLMLAGFANLPKAKREMVFPDSSPLDLILVGSDRPKKSGVFHRLQKATSGAQVATDLMNEVALLAQTERRLLTQFGLYVEHLAASNSWVVSGKHTVTGKPLLANDPHLAAFAPGMLYLTNLRSAGLHVAGATIPGIAGITIGHNEQIAWGITTLGADVQDIYAEKFNEAHPLQYLTPEGWRTAEVRSEEIKVRKGLVDTKVEAIPFSVTVTRHGPIVTTVNKVSYALRWVALDPQSSEFEAFYAINRARNWNEFCRALKSYSGFGLNFVYGDVKGNIGYYGVGRVPVRKTSDGSLPYDGATDVGDWTGYIPFEAMPHVYNPLSGIIVAANNRIVGHDYSYHITSAWQSPYRARRIYNLLTAKSRLTAEDFREIQADTYSYADANFAGEVAKMARPLAANSPEWREMLNAFDGWDSKSNAESRVMPLAHRMFEAFRTHIINAAFGAGAARGYDWSNENTFLDRVITERQREWLPQQFNSYEDLILASYKEARRYLVIRAGNDESKWTWGRLGQYEFHHSLSRMPGNPGRFPTESFPLIAGGSGATVNPGGAASMRLIVDLNNWDNTRQSVTLGQSGDPLSPHWKDQTEDWLKVTPRPFPFSRRAITEMARQVVIYK